ncbi:MAG: molybdopterin-dependent oxidoreductase, partial [Candidatus Eremiobacteraeota bacterium]|nr:molybdopterin-dependent oxidoreductase [Candidatus Eremiobacteraeota bacterium]
MGTSFGRGGATTFQQDLQNADCILIMGSNMAENHPVGFQWVMEARERGATIIHVDPRFTRTSAVANLYLPIRAGSDIAFLGGIVRYILENRREFTEYVVNYTNAPFIIDERFRDTEDLDGFFSGWEPSQNAYDIQSWQYKDMPVHAAAGRRARETAAVGEATGGHGHPIAHHDAQCDDTLEDPNCVF